MYGPIGKGNGKMYGANTSKWCRPKTSHLWQHKETNFFILIFRHQDEKEELEPQEAEEFSFN